MMMDHAPFMATRLELDLESASECVFYAVILRNLLIHCETDVSVYYTVISKFPLNIRFILLGTMDRK